ncbi:hypothetical protein ElyMa_002477000 [Elysia marginata]|uniref:Uncharacterized protein n=1 Tax=Elysia marginata TaxID=1093978 RepID=A0AAV4GM35_9GAST|nr:hypothetical protein ElyMa_002477000 [Elysia marginata]
MESVLGQYRTFFRALRWFETQFFYHVDPSCPVQVRNGMKLHEILEPDEDYFAHEKPERLAQKVRNGMKLHEILEPDEDYFAHEKPERLAQKVRLPLPLWTVTLPMINRSHNIRASR